jgi:TatD DNase family protein
MLVDTHSHLNFPDYEKDLDQVIERARKNGVSKIICVSSNLADSKKAIEIAQKYRGTVFAAVGIHPQQTDPETTLLPEEQITILADLASNPKVVAVGECGLDYSPAPPGEKDRSHEEQNFLFTEQIKIAKKLKLPIIIHSRQAFPDTIGMIKRFYTLDPKPYPLTGVFHCYSAGKKGIQKVDDLGLYFGVDGNLTYDGGLQNVFSQIPLKKILLETDAPFLSPLPNRSARNEPANIKSIAETLAKIKKVPLEEIAKVTSLNTQQLFRI